MVLVAGAGRGIECATAVALGKANTHIVLATCTKADLQTIATLVHAAGGEATVMPVMAEPHVKRLVETAAAVTGTIDVVVCSAGVVHVAPLAETSLAGWERTLRVSLTGTFLRCKHALAPMGRGGHIFHDRLASHQTRVSELECMHRCLIGSVRLCEQHS